MHFKEKIAYSQEIKEDGKGEAGANAGWYCVTSPCIAMCSFLQLLKENL